MAMKLSKHPRHNYKKVSYRGSELHIPKEVSILDNLDLRPCVRYLKIHDVSHLDLLTRYYDTLISIKIVSDELEVLPDLSKFTKLMYLNIHCKNLKNIDTFVLNSGLVTFRIPESIYVKYIPNISELKDLRALEIPWIVMDKYYEVFSEYNISGAKEIIKIYNKDIERMKRLKFLFE